MKVTYMNDPVTLEGKTLSVGDLIDFEATNTDFSEFKFSDLKGKKVISTFLSIDTGVCDGQTKKLVELSKKHPEVQFLSVSLDLPSAQGRWCAATGNENMKIVSDYKEREFSLKYGMLIKELKLTHRSLIVVDENNKVTNFLVEEEATDMPNFEKLNEILSN
ncbi:MAG: thiol peroxidase [Mycoplasmatales bacterium]|nr:thiol peroxidase [Mycoplasmatales bacterium]